ncbi:MerC domain-containing protein [Rhodohalobacter sp. SW132]|uniref:MerC domain-containing protein n=1 Tax=Rhodohalobacter sp. SW132 TaxID=2293433 RepID=UPI000E25612F|nr:MerC domain-containing protein [Rhodohalobacter sp. SW132]REL33481.1 MerC domain-containing protein [Rhodohalobacter sp. SW132]
MPDKSITASVLWDRFGIGVSGICAIHCLLLPVFIALMPVATVSSVISEWLHPLFVILIAPTVYFASKRSHFDRKVTGLLVSGFILIVAGWLIGHYWLGFWSETGLTLGGSILLILGHWKNYRHHQKCTNHNHQHHPVEEYTHSKEERHEKA